MMYVLGILKFLFALALTLGILAIAGYIRWSQRRRPLLRIWLDALAKDEAVNEREEPQ